MIDQSSSPRAATSTAPAETANDRLKRSFGARFWSSMIGAVALHFAVFALWPTMSVVEMASASNAMEALDIPLEVDIPPRPEQIQRPARPVIGDATIDPDITIAPNDWDSNPPEALRPPPVRRDTPSDDLPPFTPYTVGPLLANQDEVRRALEAEYPSVLRDAGIEGRVTVHLHIDEEGVVRETRLFEGSGYDAMDRAALSVAERMRFSPALNRDVRVAVWVQQAITFTVR